jgi:hypothetical protein
MLLPTLSVTVIGLIAGLLAVVAGGGGRVRALLLGVVGAWAGFVMGAIIGIGIDVVVQSGIYVGIVGHLIAMGGAVCRRTYAFPNLLRPLGVLCRGYAKECSVSGDEGKRDRLHYVRALNRATLSEPPHD